MSVARGGQALATPFAGTDYVARLKLSAGHIGWLLLDLLYPPRCAGCRREGERLCAHCRAEIEYIEEPLCDRCGYPHRQNRTAPTTGECDQCRRIPFLGHGLRSLALHTGPLRSALHTLKYRENTPLSQALAQLMTRRWPAPFPADAVLMPVPLSSERMRERGFNQAEVLARELGAERKLPVAVNVVRRAKHTRSQVGLNGAERIDNVAGAFAVDSHSAQNLSVILIDDVCTTGATIGACASALLQGGASQVWAFTVTRAYRDDADTLN